MLRDLAVREKTLPGNNKNISFKNSFLSIAHKKFFAGEVSCHSKKGGGGRRKSRLRPLARLSFIPRKAFDKTLVAQALILLSLLIFFAICPAAFGQENEEGSSPPPAEKEDELIVLDPIKIGRAHV